MTKSDTIKALKIGLEESINTIEFLRNQVELMSGAKDPQVQHVLEQLKQLLKYSDYTQDEPGTQSHPLYNS